MAADDVKMHLTDIDHPATVLLTRSFLCYRSLVASLEASHPLDSRTEPTLGGQLLYAGELGIQGRGLVIAGNVAGCATLAVAEDPTVQRQATRDGVVDFVVTSLDEALRILKNEIRKQTAVAVCVDAGAVNIEREMAERGVQPDLAYAGLRDATRDGTLSGHEWRPIQCSDPDPALTFVAWQVAQAPARWMVRLDDIALDCLAADWKTRRWIRLAPRFAGRQAQGLRALYCDAHAAGRIAERFNEAVRNGDIGAEVAMRLTAKGETQTLRFSPRTSD
jgi:urocanate hydratase